MPAARQGRRKTKRVPPRQKGRTQPVKRRRQPVGRAIPGTVFPIHEATRVSNWRMLNKLDRMHREGKLHLMWQLSPGMKRRLGISTRLLKQHHWFVPTRLPSTPTRGIHRRSLIARVGNRYVFLKGSGAEEEIKKKFRSIKDQRTGKEKPHYWFGEVFDWIEWPFRWRPNEEFHTARFRGGAKRAVNEEVMNIAEELRKKFREMLRKGDPVINNAWQKGIRAMPTLEPIALFKPLQIPVEYTAGHGNISSTDILFTEDWASRQEEERMRDQFRERLLPSERELFDKRYQRAKKQAEAMQRQKKFIMKVADGTKHLDIPKEVLEQQAVLAYSVASRGRVAEIGDFDIINRRLKPGSLFRGHIIGRLLARVKEGIYSLGIIGELFELNGFRVEFILNEAFPNGELRFYRQKKEVNLEQAREKIIENFVTALGTGIYTMHKGMNGTFSIRERMGGEPTIISSLNPMNVSLAGEILDLDTAQYKGDITEIRYLQQHDRVGAEELIKFMVEFLWRPEEGGKQEFINKHILKFRSIVSGKPA